MLLAERHHGRKHLIERMVNPPLSGTKRRRKEVKTGKGGLAMGYEVMEIRDDADEGQSLIIVTEPMKSNLETTGRGEEG